MAGHRKGRARAAKRQEGVVHKISKQLRADQNTNAAQRQIASDHSTTAPLHIDDVLTFEEVFEGVLCNLTPADIQEFKKVCRGWRAALYAHHHSKGILHASVLHPTKFYGSSGGYELLLKTGDGLDCCIPSYTSTRLSLHPSLQTMPHATLQLPSVVTMDLYPGLDLCESDPLIVHCDEYVTSPPCSAMLFRLRTTELPSGDDGEEYCTLYVKTGITMWDLKDLVVTLSHQASDRNAVEESITAQLAWTGETWRNVPTGPAGGIWTPEDIDNALAEQEARLDAIAAKPQKAQDQAYPGRTANDGTPAEAAPASPSSIPANLSTSKDMFDTTLHTTARPIVKLPKPTAAPTPSRTTRA